MAEKRTNPDWQDLLAPFAWLISRIMFRLFQRRWNDDPRIPFANGLKRRKDDPE